MTNEEIYELLIRIDERTKNMDEALSRDYKCLHGNGQPGLIQRVQSTESDLKDLEEKVKSFESVPPRVQTLENFHKNENGFMKKYGGALAWLITTALAVCSIIMHK